MARKSTKATLPGQPSEDVAFTPGEEIERDAEEAQAAIDVPKTTLRKQFIEEGIIRISAQVSAWDTFQTIRVIASIWSRLGPPNAAELLARDIYLYVLNDAIPRVDNMMTEAELATVDPTLADPFGDATDQWPT